MEFLLPYLNTFAWLLIAALVLGTFAYNRFVAQRNLILDAWSNIDTELRRRYDLIPNLVETVKGYAAHERAVLDTVTRARQAAIAAAGTPAEQSAAEGPLVTALRDLIALAETYPDLKASANFLKLQDELAVTEDRLQIARRIYNANVREHNRRVKQFATNFVARQFGFAEAQYFTIDEVVETWAAAAEFGEARD